MYLWEVLMVVALWATACKGEQRKLVPKCLNACLTGPQPPSNCGCDSRCSLEFNDCCLDAPYRSPAPRRRHGLQCVFVAGENDHFWMVRACAEGWQGAAQVKERCERRGGAVVSGRTSDAAGERPFTDAAGGGLTYRNLYCALCNGVAAEQLQPWRLKALCAEGVVQAQVLANLTWEEDAAQWRVAGRPCHLLFARPPAAPVRRCLGNAVSACPPGWRGAMATRRRCRAYVDPVRWGDGPVFRNVDCALCHGINITAGFECHYEVTREVSALVLDRAMNVDVERMGQWF